MKMIKKLFEPGKIGTLELKNRLIYSAMDLRCADGKGHMAPEAVTSLLERALHGIALVSLPGMYAWKPKDVPYGKALFLDNDEVIPFLEEVTAKIHSKGAKVMAQIGARGTRIEGSNTSSTAPSSMRFGYEANIPRELSVEEIEERVKLFGDAARRAREAGVDIIEVHAATGKLISMFLSPYSNHRTDKFGGDTRKRTKFLKEIITAMRKQVGMDFPISVRITVDDLVPGGIDLDEGLRIVQDVLPMVDAIQPSTGTQERIWNISSSYFMPKGNMLAATFTVKNICGEKPVIAMSKLGEPFIAEKAIENGMADFISLGRPLLADPLWAEKVKNGDFAAIRRCIGCLNCFTYNERKDIFPIGVSCTVNPEVLRESTHSHLISVPKSKRVLVIGGGLAGMECARVLAIRGHNVTIVEKNSQLGGQWLVASHSAYKNDQKTLLPWLKRELNLNGVNILLNTEASISFIHQYIPDELVVATGAEPRWLPGSDKISSSNIVQGNDVIMDKVNVGHRVVIIGGRYVGMECAVKLARSGHHVSIVDAFGIGHGTNPRILGVYRNQMVEHGVYLYPDSPVLRIMDYGVDIAHLNSMLSLKADTIVLAIGTKPVDSLANELKKESISFHMIGDCKRIGDALYAMRDGSDIGREL